MKPYRFVLAAALILGLPTAVSALPSTEMRQYVHARLADAAGMPDAAATNYGRLLADAPDDKGLALRTYRQALVAGNYKVASMAAQQLDKAGALPPDGVLMLLADAVTARNWKQASTIVSRIEREQVFGFLAPALRGWVAFGANDGDAASLPGRAPDAQLANAYARDHQLLIALARGQSSALADLRQLVSARDPRAMRLQLAAGALLAKHGDRTAALVALDGPGQDLARVRDSVEAGKVPAGAIDTPALGLSELFAQLAIDVKGDGHSPISLQLARLATYLAPDNAGALIATADLLASNNYRQAALAALDRVAEDNPLWDAARHERTSILLASGDREAALADAKKVAEARGDDAQAFVELGAILSDLDRPAEAAATFQRAIDIEAARGATSWVHLFLKASALDRAGDWEGAKTLLREANRIDPGQAIVLNYLGYGMLDRNESLAEARIFIERASALDPNDAAISDSLGWLHYKRGNYAEAIAALEKAVAGDPGQSVMNDHLGDAYWATGRRIEARYAWRAALVQADRSDAERISRKLADGLGPVRAAR